ncbi:twin-arginine translocation signal domain-containing protein [Bradyrhizobium yuanmingense]|uniref:twin-arginine translocation signal domain-containing protein n=1 Tax=Bradyrhizobium yuanmingense TaxID=108015 RepID=UPI003CC68764
MASHGCSTPCNRCDRLRDRGGRHMVGSSRRAFLGFATSALAAAAIGATGVRLIDVAEALPIDPDPRRATTSSELIKTQWGPPPRPGWGPPPRRRRHRRWVCWWHRGRRRCGWRWV